MLSENEDNYSYGEGNVVYRYKLNFNGNYKEE